MCMYIYARMSVGIDTKLVRFSFGLYEVSIFLFLFLYVYVCICMYMYACVCMYMYVCADECGGSMQSLCNSLSICMGLVCICVSLCVCICVGV